MADEQLPGLPKELSKVANNFINKIAKGIGAVYEPTHVKRMAKADAAARIIAAKADIEVTDLQRRAAARVLYEDERAQENLEAIARTAIPHLGEDAKPEALDEDWLANFFEHAKKISDKDMQTLWAKVLAGQANAPGSFRKSVLQTVALLEKEDADLFVGLCRFGFRVGFFSPIIFDTAGDIYNKRGLNFSTMSHLDDIGLVTFNSVTGFGRTGVPKTFQVSYGNQKFAVTMPDGVNQFPLGHVMLTTAGRQLAPLTNAEMVPEFPDYAIERWKGSGITVEKM